MHPMPSEAPGDALNLTKAEQLILAKELVARAKDFFGHAVNAAEIAAVGHGYAQIAQRPTELVFDRYCLGTNVGNHLTLE